MKTRTDDEMPREAIHYGRCSSDEQVVSSVRRQNEGAERYAQANGMVIVRSLFDEGLSGYHGDNIKFGKLSRLLQEIKEGKIKRGTILLVEFIDRLSRESLIAQFMLLVQFLSAGIEVITFGDNRHYTLDSINENPHDLFGVMGIMTRGNDEAKTKADRHIKNWEGKRQRAAQEKFTAMGPSWLKLLPERTRWKQLRDRVKEALNKAEFSNCNFG